MVETTPKHYLYGIIIFTMVFMAGFAIMSELNDKEGGNFQNDPRFSQFNKTFNKYDDLNSEVGGLQSSIEGSGQTEGKAFDNFLTRLINGAWNTLKSLFTGFSFITDILVGLNEMFGIPVWFTSLVSLLIIVMIAFAIWGAIFQTQF